MKYLALICLIAGARASAVSYSEVPASFLLGWPLFSATAGLLLFVALLAWFRSSNARSLESQGSEALLPGGAKASAALSSAQRLVLALVLAATLATTVGVCVLLFSSPAAAGPAAGSATRSGARASLATQLHNDFRSSNLVSPRPYSPLPRMDTVYEMEQIARGHALSCPNDHNYARDTKTVGENIYYSSSRKTEEEALRAAVKAWGDEGAYYTLSSGFCSKSPCGHYVQLVNAKSDGVGCYVNTECRSQGSWYETVVVCNYRGAVVGRINGVYQPPYSTQRETLPPTRAPYLGPIAGGTNRELYVRLHNEYRAKVSPRPSRPIGQLRYSARLEEAAKSWAQLCDPDHDDDRGFNTGENLAFMEVKLDTDAAIRTGIKDWFELEAKNWDYYSKRCNGAACGHYQQMVDSQATEVGCFVKNDCRGFTAGIPFKTIVVCRYNHQMDRFENPYSLSGDNGGDNNVATKPVVVDNGPTIDAVCLTGNVNLRTGGSASSPKLPGIALKGRAFQLVGELRSTRYAQLINCEDGQTVYAHGYYLEKCRAPCKSSSGGGGGGGGFDPIPSPQPAPVASTGSRTVCATTTVNKRNGPSSGNTAVGLARSGDAFTLNGELDKSGYVQVRECATGATVYMHGAFLQECRTQCTPETSTTTTTTTTRRTTTDRFDPVTARPQPSTGGIACTTSMVNKRDSELGSSSGTVDSGTPFQLVGTYDKWSYVELRDCSGRTAWIHGYYLDTSCTKQCSNIPPAPFNPAPVNAAPAPASNTGGGQSYCTTDWVNRRAGPSFSASILGTSGPGDVFTLLDDDAGNGYKKLRRCSDGSTAYVSGTYVGTCNTPCQ